MFLKKQRATCSRKQTWWACDSCIRKRIKKTHARTGKFNGLRLITRANTRLSKERGTMISVELWQSSRCFYRCCCIGVTRERGRTSWRPVGYNGGHEYPAIVVLRVLTPPKRGERFHVLPVTSSFVTRLLVYSSGGDTSFFSLFVLSITLSLRTVISNNNFVTPLELCVLLCLVDVRPRVIGRCELRNATNIRREMYISQRNRAHDNS